MNSNPCITVPRISFLFVEIIHLIGHTICFGFETCDLVLQRSDFLFIFIKFGFETFDFSQNLGYGHILLACKVIDEESNV